MHQLGVSLEDLYNGVTRKLALQKNVICGKCEGKKKKSWWFQTPLTQSCFIFFNSIEGWLGMKG